MGKTVWTNMWSPVLIKLEPTTLTSHLPLVFYSINLCKAFPYFETIGRLIEKLNVFCITLLSEEPSAAIWFFLVSTKEVSSLYKIAVFDSFFYQIRELQIFPYLQIFWILVRKRGKQLFKSPLFIVLIWTFHCIDCMNPQKFNAASVRVGLRKTNHPKNSWF